MTITIVTLYRGHSAETYVAAVKGELTPEQKRGFIDRFQVNEAKDDDDEDTMGFAVVELHEQPEHLTTVMQAFPEDRKGGL